ncbi:MAG: type II toxin-antitoxin system VapC family toxin [Pseudolysinimonas sp.]
MIVVDTSAWVDVALGRAPDRLLSELESDGHWVVPEHFRLEALSALRGAYLGGTLDALGFARAARELADAGVDVWPTEPLVPRILQLAENANPYDAAFIALAEELGCRLVTADAKLARVPGIRCAVVGFPS